MLFRSVRNYLADVYRFDHAARRHPGRDRVVHGDDGAAAELPGATPPPEAAFHRAWISMLVQESAEALREGATAFDHRARGRARTGMDELVFGVEVEQPDTPRRPGASADGLHGVMTPPSSRRVSLRAPRASGSRRDR